ncbi:MAG: hypothetical protein HFH45_06650 [Bacilli bacterium]|nr:hypothetical protein [Bacilli bacterium]
MKKTKGITKLHVFSGAAGAVLGTGAGYVLSSGEPTTAVLAIAGCTIGVLTAQLYCKDLKKETLAFEEEIENLQKENEELQKENEHLQKTLNRSVHYLDYCFKAGTLVLMENGYKNIEDVTSGDLVYSYNVETKSKEVKKVLKTFINECTELLTITINNTEMILTPNHTCYVNGQWVLASEIKIGDKMLDCDNNVLVVENIQSSKVTDKVYNFEVEDNHNYFVTDLNILVHNDSGLDSF